MENLINFAMKLKANVHKVIFLLGFIAAVKLLYKAIAYRILIPVVKSILKLFRAEIALEKGTPTKFVIVYGACTRVGRLVAKVIAVKFGYSVFLIDQNLSKLQELETELKNVGLMEGQEVRILNLNFARCPDSTMINHKLHRIVFMQEPCIPSKASVMRTEDDPPIPQIPVLIDCSHFIQEGVTCS